MGILKLLNYKNYMKKSTDAQPTTWGDMYRFFENHGAITENLVNALLWQPETTYKVGAGVSSPSLPPGTIARCTVAGTTGGEEPQWTAVGTTLTDGTVTWLIETQVNTAIMEQVNNLNKTISDLHTTVTRETEARFLKAFPVGTIIETKVDVNPGTYIGGTWEELPPNLCLQTGDASEAGNQRSAGLPNITGRRVASWGGGDYAGRGYTTGCFKQNTDTSYPATTDGENWNGEGKGSGFAFDASLSNPIYGRSNTVQPPAYIVRAFVRTS